MKNLARAEGAEPVDHQVSTELTNAGIDTHISPFAIPGEVPTSVFGLVGPWRFIRAWRYWVAEGPGIPVKLAEQLWESHGKQVRVRGHAGGMTPRNQYDGFGVGMYHVDTIEGLRALADVIKLIVRENQIVLDSRN